MQEVRDQEENIWEISQDFLQLTLLSHDMVLHPLERRPRKQWLNKHKSIQQRFTVIRLTEKRYKKKSLVLQKRTNELLPLFNKLANLSERLHETVLPKEKMMYREQRDRTIGQLNTKVQSTVNASVLLLNTLRRDALNRIAVVEFYMLAITTVITMLLVFLTFRLRRSIINPLSLLHRGTELIGKGDLSYRVGTGSSDEIGQLSRSFDEMTTQLQWSTTSRRKLEAEIESRKYAEDALKRTKNGLQEAQRIAHLGNWDWNITEGTLAWSNGIYRIFGIDPEGFGATYEAFLNSVHPEDRGSVRNAVGESLGDRTIPYDIEHRVVRPDGKERIVHEIGEVIRDDDEAPVRMIGTVQDITEQKQAEIALRRSEAKYHYLADNIPQKVFYKDCDSNYLAVNLSYARDFGLLPSDLIGKTDYDLYPVELAEKYRHDDQKVVASGEVREFDDEYLLNDALRIVHIVKTPVRDERNNVIGILGIFWDVTERRQEAEELSKTTKKLKSSNKELQDFAYVVSHDLQEPLRMVSSYMRLLERRYKAQLDDDADDFINFAVDGATRMSVMIEGLLQYARVQSQGKSFKSTDMESVYLEALDNLKVAIEENNGEVTHDPLPQVLADGSQMLRVLQNLIANALKFHGKEPPRVHIRAEREDGTWEFVVQDNGIGIDSKNIDRVFVIFQRLHTRDEYAGTGIGLAVCKRIVERHQGRIWVESELGKGTIFHFTVPVADENWPGEVPRNSFPESGEHHGK